jgi:hypothetical protein
MYVYSVTMLKLIRDRIELEVPEEKGVRLSVLCVLVFTVLFGAR